MNGSDVDARLRRLERSNRRLRGLVGLALLFGAVPLIVGYTPPNDRIEASEFVVRDKAGVVRARLFVDEQNTTQLVLADRDGKSKAILATGKGGSLVLTDKDGAPTTALSASLPKPPELPSKAATPASTDGPLDVRQ